MRATPAVLALAVAIPLLLVAVGPGASNSGGVPGVGKGGCTCHGASPSPEASVNVTGLPAEYDPGANYSLTITVTGPAAIPVALNQGGFSLDLEAATDAGTLTPAGADAQVEGAASATHTAAGNDQRSWQLTWTAPPAGSGPVALALAGNAVNGDGLNDQLDGWARLNLTIPEAPPPPAPTNNTTAPEAPPAETPGPALLLSVGISLAVAGGLAARRRDG